MGVIFPASICCISRVSSKQLTAVQLPNTICYALDISFFFQTYVYCLWAKSQFMWECVICVPAKPSMPCLNTYQFIILKSSKHGVTEFYECRFTALTKHTDVITETKEGVMVTPYRKTVKKHDFIIDETRGIVCIWYSLLESTPRSNHTLAQRFDELWSLRAIDPLCIE